MVLHRRGVRASFHHPTILSLNSSTIHISWLSLAAVYGYQNAFGVYQDVYTRSHAASTSRISWIGSTQLFFMVALALPAGKLLDMGYFRLTTFIGSLIYVFS